MEDRELQNALSSGEITNIKVGGTTTANEVATKGDIELSILSAGSNDPLVAQTLVAGTPTKLVWIIDDTIKIGTDIAYNATLDNITIATSGVYKIGGAVSLEAASGDVLDIHLRVNDVETPYCNQATGKGAGKPVSISYYSAVAFNSSDVLTLYIESSGTSIEVQTANMVVEKIS